jgi:hypothetical protein
MILRNLVDFHQISRRYILEDWILQSRRCEDHKSEATNRRVPWKAGISWVAERLLTS